MRSKAWPRISVLGPHPYCRFRAATDVVMPDELATSASGIEGATWHGSWHEREDFPGSRRGWRPAIGAASTLGDAGAHAGSRPPEAGAQVRILPGAPTLSCSNSGGEAGPHSGRTAQWTVPAREVECGTSVVLA